MAITAHLFTPAAWLRLQQPDLSDPMREIGRRLETSVIQNYNQQKSPAGIPWIPSRRAVKDGGKTLIDTGLMLASLTYVSGRDWVDMGYPRGGKNIPAWLHYGVRQNNLPAREHLGMKDSDKDAVHHAVKRYFENLLR